MKPVPKGCPQAFNKTYIFADQLNSRDISQIENLHQAGPIARADWMITNEGSKEELFGKLDEVVNKLM